jgi:hypothetical protein
MVSRFTRSVPVTVMDALDGHVALDLECLDRLYLHGYLAPLQVGGQVIQFLSHRGYPVPSPACLQQIGDAFRRRVASFAEANQIPVVTLKAGSPTPGCRGQLETKLNCRSRRPKGSLRSVRDFARTEWPFGQSG